MNKKWMKWILPVAALGVGVAGFVTISASAEKSNDEEIVDTRPTVSVMALETTDFQVTITSYGEVKPVESTLLAAQVSGEVMSWNPDFTAGGLVKRGDVLFTIEKDAYDAALLQAEANLSRAQAALIEEEAKAKVAEQEASRLGQQVSDLYLRKPQVMSAKADVKSAQAALKLARRDLANCEVVAPYDALVISRTLGAGQFVNTGTTVAELNNIEAAEVTFPIPGFDQSFLPETLSGVKAEVHLGNRQPIVRQAQINRDLGIVDTATRMGHVVARIEDPYSLKSQAPALKFGSYVEIQFPGRVLTNVYQLPQTLISNNRVWLVNQDNKLEPREVQVLREEGEYFLIHHGLTNEDRVVTTVPDYPQKGMEVKLSEPDAQLAQR